MPSSIPPNSGKYDCAEPAPRVLVLRYTVTRELRTEIDRFRGPMAVSASMRDLLLASGLEHTADVDPESIRFSVE